MRFRPAHACLSGLLTWAGAAHAVPVTFDVEVPLCTPTSVPVMLRSNRLDVASFRHDALTQVDRTHWRGTFDVTVARTQLQYRYSSGVCDTNCPGIEKILTYTGRGADRPERTLVATATHARDLVYVWRSAVAQIAPDGTSPGPRTAEQQVAACAPYLSVNTEEGGVSLSYDSYDAGNVRLDHGPSTAYGQTLAQLGQHRNHFALGQLPPGQRWYYRLSEDGREVTSGDFPTPVAPGQPFRFAFVGDTQYYADQQYLDTQAMVGLVRGFDPHLVLSAGDLVASEQDAGGAWIRPEMARFSLIFGQLAPLMAQAPLMVSMGNHEEDAPYYWSVFDFPQPDAPRIDHYWFKYGNVMFIMLYTGVTDDYDLNGILESQTLWMRDVLAASQADPDVRWRVAVLHRVPFSQGANHTTDGANFFDGGNGSRPAWRQLWSTYGVDLVIGGHNHNLTVAENDRIRYVTACSGAPVHELITPWYGTTLHAERACTANLFRVGAQTLGFEAQHLDGTPVPQAAFSLCKATPDCSELDNPCPEGVTWSCDRPVCRAACRAHDTLGLSRTALSWTSDAPNAEGVDVTSSGTDALEFELSDVPSWLDVTPQQGTTPATLALTPDAAGLAEGTYTATIGVHRRIAPQTVSIAVRFEVEAQANTPPTAPELVSPEDGATVARDAVELVIRAATDADGDALSYRYTLSCPSGAAEATAAELRVSIAAATLMEGEACTWRVRASDARGAEGPWSATRALNLAGPTPSPTPGPTASPSVTPAPPVDDGGCTCADASGAVPEAWLTLALAGICVVQRRRRA